MNLNIAMNIGRTFAKNRLKKYDKKEVMKQAVSTKKEIEKIHGHDVSQWWFSGATEVLDGNGDS